MESEEIKMISGDDIKAIERFIDAKNHGERIDGREVANVYNRVMSKPVTPSNCGACVRGQISRLEDKLRKIQKLLAKESGTEVEEAPKDTFKSATKQPQKTIKDKSKRKE